MEMFLGDRISTAPVQHPDEDSEGEVIRVTGSRQVTRQRSKIQHSGQNTSSSLSDDVRKQMKEIKTRNNEENRSKRPPKNGDSHPSKTSSPYLPGKNTIKGGNGGGQQSTKAVNDSRQPLREPPRAKVTSSFNPAKPLLRDKINLGGPQRFPTHLGRAQRQSETIDLTLNPSAGPSRLTFRSSNHEQEPDALDSEPDEPVRTLRIVPSSSRSRSPEKQPSSAQKYTNHCTSSDDDTSGHPPRLSLYTLSKDKGKGKLREDVPYGSSPTKQNGSLSLLMDDHPEEVQDSDGIFQSDLKPRGPDIDEEIEYISPPSKHVLKQTLQQRQSSVINSHMGRQESTSPIKNKSRLQGMKDKNGNLRSEAKPPKLKSAAIKKQVDGTIPSSMPGAFAMKTADVEKAWFAPDQEFKCHSLALTMHSLRIVANIGQEGNFWDVPLKSMKRVSIGNHQARPFLQVDLQINSQYEKASLVAYLNKSGPRINLHNLDVLEPLMLSLCSQKAPVPILTALKDRISQFKCEVELLDQSASNTLQDSCNSQIRDTRTRSRNQMMERSRKVSDAAETGEEAAVSTSRQKAPRKSAPQDDEPLRTRSNTKDKMLDDPSQSKLNFPPRAAASRRSTRNSAVSGNDVPDLEGSDSEQFVPPTKPKPVQNFRGEKSELLFPFPLEGRAGVNVTIGDAQRIETGEFLNDTLLEFGLRHALHNLQEERQKEVHLFNSFFYERLSDRTKKPKTGEEMWPGYESVKKWSKGKDIFDKKFVVVPINEHFHWYLAVIVNPKGILRPKSQKDEEVAQGHGLTTRAVPGDTVTENVSRSTSVDVNTELQVAEPLTTSGRLDSDLDDLDSQHSDPASRHPSPNLFGSHDDRLSNVDPDTTTDDLDCIGDDSTDIIEVDRDLRGVSKGVSGLDLNGEKSHEKDLVGTGGFISTPTLQAIQQQNEQITNLAQKGIADSPAKKRPPLKPDAKIIDSEDTWILTFDSLGGPHRAVSNTLNAWLKYEAKDKKGIDYDPTDAVYWEGRCLTQDNFYDCGLYVVHYAKQFLERPNAVLEVVQRRPPVMSSDDREPWEEDLKKVWREVDTKNLRKEWTGTMLSLAGQYEDNQPPKSAQQDEQETKKDEESLDAIEVDPSQVESIAIIGPSQILSAFAEHPENSIPGAFPRPTPKHPSPSPSPSPSPPLSASPKSPLSASPSIPERPENKSESPITDRGRRLSMDIDPVLSAPTTHGYQSVSPEKVAQSSPDNRLTGSLQHPEPPSIQSMQHGTVRRTISQLDPLHVFKEVKAGPSRRALSPQKSSRGIEHAGGNEDEEARLQDVESLRPPGRQVLGEISVSSVSSLGPVINDTSPIEEIHLTRPSSDTQNRDAHNSSPFSNFGKLAPSVANKIHVSPGGLALDVKRSPSRRRSDSLPISDEEEEELVEDLPPKAKFSPIHTYTKGKGKRANGNKVEPTMPSKKTKVGKSLTANATATGTLERNIKIAQGKEGSSSNEPISIDSD
ncbi:uncharacterized protein IL334_001799 [Kwoniella shivajii]|uniref:Ubiquitin-like protease family profile domain-containing protein n=1 Tax=Kwoniella shivajii TaxID=564305 RepID=A0ABZ1CT66_9TREE|nr:hypothetical protein IL334_001799 [Kwoniella shivajii]